MNKFEEVKKEIEDILPSSPISIDLRHAQATLKWLLKIKPDADEALKIAALSHDIDRAVNKITSEDRKQEQSYEQFKKEHALRSAKIICEILQKYKYDDHFIGRVKYLVEHHEEGGGNDADVLTDADSIAYFELEIPIYLKRNGKDRTISKIKFMYNRMTRGSKEILLSLSYEEDVKELIEVVINKKLKDKS